MGLVRRVGCDECVNNHGEWLDLINVCAGRQNGRKISDCD